MSGHVPQLGAVVDGLSPKCLAEALGCSLRTVYNRAQGGGRYVLKDGKILPESLRSDEKHHVWEFRFKRAGETAIRLWPHASPASDSSTQLDLLPKTEEDRRLVDQLMRLAPAQRPAIMARFRSIKPTLNHDHRALGYPTIGKYVDAEARRIGVCKATVWRWRERYLQNEDLCSLVDGRPGPQAAGFGAVVLDVSMRAHIRECWEIKKLTRAQTYANLIGYLKEKQRGCGAAWVYPVPSKATVYRFINRELRGDVNPWRRGPDAVKAWAGHADRTYRNLPSLGQVECDEWNANVLAFEPRRADRVLRFWVVTLYDTRSTLPLAWLLLGAAEGEKKLHGITQQDEQRLFVRLVAEYGVPESFYSDRGRFRGSFWGGEPGARAKRRDEEFARSDGILESLGIKHRMPREKNPRGSRLERFHRFLSDKCRDLPGWIRANDQEREMTPGDRHAVEHADFVAGRRETTPLLTKDQLLEHINGWMEEWREHPSDGTDMDGLSPRAVFLRSMPAGGFRKLEKPELEFLAAEWYPNRVVRAAGIIELPDGTRYGLPGELTQLQGTKRHIVRMPNERGFVLIKAQRKGEPDIVAHLRPRLGIDDPKLSQWTEAQQRVRKVAEARLEHPSPESNAAEILEPYGRQGPARRQPRFAGNTARDALEMEAGQ